MRKAYSIHFVLLVLATISVQHTPTSATKQMYIVYLGTHQHGPNPTQLDAKIATQSHYDFMRSILGSAKKARKSVLYSYNKYINGFVAKLTKDEAERIKTSPRVISVFDNRRLQLHTTRSWEFLGLERDGVTPSDSLWNISEYGNDVIIGDIDSGVWPESKSFNDQGMGPIPSRWKGTCMTGFDPTFKCNNKLIGAKYFRIESNITQPINQSLISPRDIYGHGTHTLSTAAGSFVRGASVYGIGKGIAKGGSPNARVAAYRICWPDQCTMAELLAAFEAAISDGVDVLSIQLGDVEDTSDYKSDLIAIGSFHVIRHGITMIASAGNEGSDGASTVSNIAPWIFTVAASTSDRTFFNEIYLGNSTLHFKGTNSGPNRFPKRDFYPLIDGASAKTNTSTVDMAHFCAEGSLDPSKVKGKIVVCQVGGPDAKTVFKGKVVLAAGGAGMIVVYDKGDSLPFEPHFLPASDISYQDGQTIRNYIRKTMNPTAYITEVKTMLNTMPSPVMADFSSKGPSRIHPFILKPDITAPGVNIIAAYTGALGPSGFEEDTRRVNYNVKSGTSMSSPHISGIVGLVKSIHPDWSPAAIRSALMTTATTYGNDNKPIRDSNGQQATPFDYGAGHINPNAAANPGLIYNLTEIDYLDFLCSIGYSEKDLKLLTPVPYKCTNLKNVLNFNYPSIAVTNFTISATLTRVVTNVGNFGTYKVKVIAPFGVNVTVFPSRLKFNRTGEELTYRVELKANGKRPKKPEYVFGSLVWSDGIHNVRSPLVLERV